MPLQRKVNILGVEVNNTLSFTTHVKKTASKAVAKLNCVRRVSLLLDAKEITNFYTAQVRSVMEYAPLAWSSCPFRTLVSSTRYRVVPSGSSSLRHHYNSNSPHLQTLQHRRDVSGLCATYKIHRQGATHLPALLQPWATPHPHSTRDAHTRAQQLVPFARTETFLRTVVPRYTRLWNHLVKQTDIHQAATLHSFKYTVNVWLMTNEQ